MVDIILHIKCYNILKTGPALRRQQSALEMYLFIPKNCNFNGPPVNKIKFLAVHAKAAFPLPLSKDGALSSQQTQLDQRSKQITPNKRILRLKYKSLSF